MTWDSEGLRLSTPSDPNADYLVYMADKAQQTGEINTEFGRVYGVNWPAEIA